jgi:hypothetical protein
MTKKQSSITLVVIALAVLSFRIFCGIFVIQPIGALPEGATIVYWRSDMNMPFIASADGMLDQKGDGVSLFGRGLMLAALAKPIKEREIFRFGYYETIYLWSTDGKTYEH